MASPGQQRGLNREGSQDSAEDERPQASAGARSSFTPGSLRRPGHHTPITGEQRPMRSLGEA